jgi:hypothetical protein
MSPSGGGGGDDNNVKVMTRVRLFNKREIEISEKEKRRLQPCVRMRDKTVAIMEFYTDASGFPQEKEREAFDFDEAFWSMPLDQAHSLMPYADQKFVYERSGLVALKAAIDGYNVTIFAYGQTGSGKTYSMLGAPTDPGISPRMVDDLFASKNPMIKMTVECVFFEIYNENVRDLFNKKSKIGDYDAPKIRQHPTKGVFVEGLSRKEVSTAEVTKNLIEKGTKERAMAETKMNAHSSRSHAVFQIQITQADPMKGTQKVSTINLVDLAGSEKIKLSGVTDKALDEAKAINQSLSTLRKVIDVLIDNSKIRNPKLHKLPPYRESVLTYDLKDSLGGNSKTMMIAAISPHECNMEDTMGTLRYALRAKAIVCDAKVNEEKSAAMMDAMRDEIMALQQKLRDGTGGGGGGGGGMTSEIKEEIEMRVKEIERMDRDLQNAHIREEEMVEKMKEAEVAKAELNVVVETQKKERFAAAFRNAFLINVEKKKQESSRMQSEALLQQKHELTHHNAYLTSELNATKELYTSLRDTTEHELNEKNREIFQRDQLLSSIRKQLSNALTENSTLSAARESLYTTVQAQEAKKSELERRVQRQQEELLACMATVDRHIEENKRLTAEKEQVESNYEEELENMRKRKDKYKLMYMEVNAKAEAARSVVDALQGDRQSFITTIKAQQQVVEEQSSAVKRLAWDRKDCDDKARRLERSVTQKEEDIKLMSEALREYQNAATEFIYENHTVQRELERVSRQNTELKITAERKAASLSPSPIKYRTSPRPSTLTPTRRAPSQPHQQQQQQLHANAGYSRLSTASSIGRSPHY